MSVNFFTQSKNIDNTKKSSQNPDSAQNQNNNNGATSIADYLNGSIQNGMQNIADNIASQLTNENFDPKSAWNSIFGSIESEAENIGKGLIKSGIESLLGFNDTAATAARTGKGAQTIIDNLDIAKQLKETLIESSTNVLMRLASTGQITIEGLSAQLSNIIQSTLDPKQVAETTMNELNDRSEENDNLKQEAQSIEAEIKEFLAQTGIKDNEIEINTNDKTFDSNDSGTVKNNTSKHNSKTKNIKLPPELQAKQDRLTEIYQQISNNNKIIKAGTEILKQCTSTIENLSTQAVATQNQIINTSNTFAQQQLTQFNNMASSSKNQLMTNAQNAAQKDATFAQEGQSYNIADKENSLKQTAEAIKIKASSSILGGLFGGIGAIFTNSITDIQVEQLVQNATENMSASILNKIFGKDMISAGIKELMNGKSLSDIIIQNILLPKVKEQTNEILNSAITAIQNPLNGIWENTSEMLNWTTKINSFTEQQLNKLATLNENKNKTS